MRSPSALKPVLKGFAGFLLGLAIWMGLTAAYNAVVARPAEAILRTVENPAVTRIRPSGHEVIIDRDDFPPKSPRPGVPLRDLTFNIVLVVALFASSEKTFSNRNVVGFLLACILLYVTHVLALIVTIQSIYALKLGPWSLAKYGSFARNFWGTAEHFYRLVGMYAIGFASWWIFRPAGVALSRAKNPRRRKSR